MNFYKQIERIGSHLSDWRVFTTVSLAIWIVVTLINHPEVTIIQLLISSLGVIGLVLVAYVLDDDTD